MKKNLGFILAIGTIWKVLGLSIAVGTLAITNHYLLTPIAVDFDRIATAKEIPTGQSIQLLHTLTGHDRSVFGIKSLTIAPDGRTLVSGARDGKIILWDLRSGKQLRKWIGDTEGVETLAIDRHGQTLVSGGIDKTIKVWSFPKGQILHTINGHSAPVSKAIVFTEPQTNRQLLMSASDDRQIQIWDLNQHVLVGSLAGITGYAADLTISPNRLYAIAAQRQGVGDNTPANILIWNLAKRKLVRTIAAPTSGFDSLAITPDSKYLIGGSFGQLESKDRAINTLKIWQISTGKQLYDFPDNVNSIESVVVSKDGRLLAAGTYDGRVKIWDLQTRKLLSQTQSYGKPIGELTISPDRRTLVGGSDDGRILVWQLNNLPN